jgi:hypothetical protein
MYYSELIHDFLEGTLDKSQQEVFFITLSSNEEFRQELIESIRIDRSFSARLSQMTPSAASTYTVFSKLGFTPPAFGSTSNKIPFYKKYMQGLVASLVSILITSLVFGLILINKDNTPDQFYSAGVNATYPLMKSVELTPKTNRLIASVNDFSTKEPVIQNRHQNTGFINQDINSLSTVKSDVPVNNTENNNNIDYPDYLAQSEISIFDNSMPESANTVSNVQDISNITSASLDVSDAIDYKGWGIELKASYYVPGGVKSNGNLQGEQFSNIGINLTYKATDDIKLLIGIANQRFERFFEGIDSYDNIYKYSQLTPYINISAGIKYDFLNLDEFTLFAQGSAGVLHDLSGGTGSLQLGVEYSPSSEYTLILNSEFMVLGFSHQGEKLYLPKVGLNFGVGLNF